MFVVVVCCCCWLLLLVVVVGCCCWLLLLVVVFGCCCWLLLLLVVVVGCCCCWLLLLLVVVVVGCDNVSVFDVSRPPFSSSKFFFDVSTFENDTTLPRKVGTRLPIYTAAYLRTTKAKSYFVTTCIYSSNLKSNTFF